MYSYEDKIRAVELAPQAHIVSSELRLRRGAIMDGPG